VNGVHYVSVVTHNQRIASEKLKVGDRSRVFNDWSSKSFTENAGKVICLICQRNISIMKVYNIRYHFEEHERLGKIKSAICKLL
jgi:hypothetical protein